MGVISKDKNVIKLFYNSTSKVGRQTYSYLDASFKDLLSIDTEKTNVTGTQWAELCDMLNCELGDLVDKEHPSFTDNYDDDTELSDEDWIKVLNKTPEVFVYPVVIMGKKVYRIRNYSDIEKHLEPNSQGLDEQNPK